MSVVPILLGAIGVLLLIGTAVLKKLITDEVTAYVPALSARLVCSAARKLPERWRERYEQEWIGEVASYRDRRISGFAYALRIRLSAQSLASVLDLRAPDFSPSADTPPPAVMSPTAAAPIIAALVSRTEPPQSPWEEVHEDMGTDDFDVTDELEQIDRTYAEQLGRARSPMADRPGVLDRMRRYHELWTAARFWPARSESDSHTVERRRP